ncbi:MAG: hypothetical protein K2Y22_13970 [Candidatus Obscuribacterales bacterium]|nr:hypothetical protein [Candidatus Obscuribacterales bacterium]
MERFDLLEFQQRARQLTDPKKLFELWEDVCRRFDRREIGNYELDEMKEVIFPALKVLAALKEQVDQPSDSTEST